MHQLIQKGRVAVSSDIALGYDKFQNGYAVITQFLSDLLRTLSMSAHNA